MTGRAIIAGVFIALFAAASASAAPARRFALIIGNNQGGPGTTELRFAESDTKKIYSVLRELGGYRAQDIVKVLGGTASDVLTALDKLEVQIKSAQEEEDAHTTLLLYYSGHAKNGEMRLGQTRLPMRTLRKLLTASDADIRIGILDSCESGAITRDKGGRRGPSFLLDIDDREAARGLILISSSSENETSQESDVLRGSFFTHYLASGLRGDADSSGDQRVSLGEVYGYAYHKTVTVTADMRRMQHPTYHYDLKGQGDVVLTDITQGTSGIQFAAPIVGDFMIFDEQRTQVPAEITKVAGEARKLALPPGNYVLKKRLSEHLLVARFSLAPNSYYQVDEEEMEEIGFEDDPTTPKGMRVERIIRPDPARLALKTVFVYQSFFSKDARNILIPPVLLIGIGAEAAPMFSGKMKLELLLGGKKEQNLILGDLSLGYDFFQVQVAISLVWALEAGPFSFYGGPRLAGIYLKRSFPNDEILKHHPQDHFGLSPALTTGVIFYPGEDKDLSFEATARFGYLAFSVDENRSLFFGEFGLLLGYRL